MNQPLRIISFATKAQNLKALIGIVRSGEIPPLRTYTFADWRENSERVLSEICRSFVGATLIVRSSASHEDKPGDTRAGQFASVPNMSCDDRASLEQAIKKVFASYGSFADDDEVIIQKQVGDITMSGVMFTRDLVENSPYYVVNYDESGEHDSVTSGHSGKFHTWVGFRGKDHSGEDDRLVRLLTLAKELESLFGCDRLDIEFAFDKLGALYLLQVRPLPASRGTRTISDSEFAVLLDRIYEKLLAARGHHPRVRGSKGVFSVMSDWNPAEIIGLRPRKLSLSLYKELITDSIWAYQRDNYGYRNLRSFPLMLSLMGLPYIDVRASFNSFIPKDLDDEIAGKLVDYYLESFCLDPSQHDKIEFNVVFSCFDLSLERRITSLATAGFSQSEIEQIKVAIRDLTNRVLNPDSGPYLVDLKKIKELESRFGEIRDSSLPLLDKIYWIIEDCKRYGTLRFAGLARAGFIAVQILRSLVDVEVITPGEMEQFMASLDTVTRRFTADFAAYRSGSLSKESILTRYGHLRPGTYDITSWRYDEAFELIFDGDTADSDAIGSTSEPPAKFVFSESQLSKLGKFLQQHQIAISPQGLIDFIRMAIEGREYSKFVFTKSVSQVLLLLEELGQRYGITRDEMSQVDIKLILDLYSTVEPAQIGDAIRESIQRSCKHDAMTRGIRLPSVILEPRDVYSFYLLESKPTFVTRSRIRQNVVLSKGALQDELKNKIVCIQNADPGYDWLFSRSIAGLVTMFGGANSHMAIRCAELQIPAVIGCGEDLFHTWSKSGMLDIDCANKMVTVIS